MKIVFLAATANDISWFRFYYSSVFPEGSKKAAEQLKNVQVLLSANPYMGRPSLEKPEVRELPLTRTPFLLIYRVTEVQIEVLRVWDTRQGQEY